MKYFASYIFGNSSNPKLTFLFTIQNVEEQTEVESIMQLLNEYYLKSCRFLLISPNSDYGLKHFENTKTICLDQLSKSFIFYSHHSNNNAKSITIKIIADSEIESNKIDYVGIGIDEVILSKKWIDYEGCQDLNLIIWAAKSRCGKIIYI